MIEDPIKAYRKRNKDEYNTRNISNFGTDQSRGSNATPFGSDSQDLGGHATGTSRDQEGTGDGDRRSEAESSRARQRGRRFSNYGRSVTERDYQTTGPIGLTRAGGELDEEPKRPVGRPRKIIPDIDVKKFFPKKGVLTEQEANNYEERLPPLLQSYSEYLDQFIAWKIGATEEIVIWSDLTLTEAKALSHLLLKRGRRNGYAAEIARQLIDGEDYIIVGAAFVPRFMRTVEAFRGTSKRKR